MTLTDDELLMLGWLTPAAYPDRIKVEDLVPRLADEVRRLRAENARLDNERREAHVFLTGKFETGWCLANPDGKPETELGKAACRLLQEKRALEERVGGVRWAPASVFDDGDAPK